MTNMWQSLSRTGKRRRRGIRREVRREVRKRNRLHVVSRGLNIYATLPMCLEQFSKTLASESNLENFES